MKARYTFIYNRKNKLNVDGMALIQLEVYLNRKRKYISTGIYIKPNQWNERTRAIQKHKMQLALNSKLTELQTKIETYELKLGKAFELDRISECLEGNPASLIDWIEKELTGETTISYNTKRRYICELNHLKQHRPNLAFNEVSINLIEWYDKALKATGIGQSAMYNFHAFFRKYLKRAKQQGLVDDYPYEYYKVPPVLERRVFIDWDGLKRFEEIRISDKSLNDCLQMFLFACYTGLRFSDVSTLKWSDITDNTLRKVMQKTGKEIELPLNLLFEGKPMIILESIPKNNEYIFTRLSKGQIARNIKTLANLSNNKKNVTFHVARHTFGTLMADLTGDPFLVKQLMGHEDMATTMKYFHENNEMRNKKLAKIDWRTPYADVTPKFEENSKN